MRSRVIPGSSPTMARRRPVIRLNSVDLPTLGRPTMTMLGKSFIWKNPSREPKGSGSFFLTLAYYVDPATLFASELANNLGLRASRGTEGCKQRIRILGRNSCQQAAGSLRIAE